jgi:NADH:ubiquinone oxidoreductase subunit C
LDCLVDIFAVDFPSFYNRFFITYSFLSFNLCFRVFFKVVVSIFSLVPSLSNFFLNSSWLEREIWDLFGIRFFMHYDLRRILLDYGFLGHPLLKNFPLAGYLELRYDDSFSSVMFEPIELSQKLRFFFFDNPWLS